MCARAFVTAASHLPATQRVTQALQKTILDYHSAILTSDFKQYKVGDSSATSPREADALLDFSYLCHSAILLHFGRIRFDKSFLDKGPFIGHVFPNIKAIYASDHGLKFCQFVERHWMMNYKEMNRSIAYGVVTQIPAKVTADIFWQVMQELNSKVPCKQSKGMAFLMEKLEQALTKD